ncbi:MAG: STAS/SEC14 domain-containing protein [Saprospiraceae bacterium]|nr:STAS/SEC14 domain-containing protein [Saprospiraceae bacterium]
MAIIELKPQVKVELSEILNGISQLDVKELESFFNRVGTLLAHRKTRHLSEREFQLLSEINKGLPEEHRQKYLALKEKRQLSALTEAEAQEMASMVAEVEQVGVRRLENLVELAKLRGVEVKALMKQLGIQAPLAYA